jgi:hypothetical protein
MRRKLFSWLVALGVAGCATFQSSDTRATERMLAAAGFQPKAADTPEKLAHLRTLSPRNVVLRQGDGAPYYVFADPDECRCLYVGSAAQYEEYRKLRRQRDIADEEWLTAADREDLIGGIWGPWTLP